MPVDLTSEARRIAGPNAQITKYLEAKEQEVEALKAAANQMKGEKEDE